jgi:hypothetical protein
VCWGFGELPCVLEVGLSPNGRGGFLRTTAGGEVFAIR